MSFSETMDLLAGEVLIFGIVWVFYSAGLPVFAVILFVALHLIAHNGHVGFRDKNEILRDSTRARAYHQWEEDTEWEDK